MAFFLFIAIEVPNGAVYGLVFVASVEMNNGVRHSSFEAAGVNINRSSRLLVETNFLPMHCMPLLLKDRRITTAWKH